MIVILLKTEAFRIAQFAPREPAATPSKTSAQTPPLSLTRVNGRRQSITEPPSVTVADASIGRQKRFHVQSAAAASVAVKGVPRFGVAGRKILRNFHRAPRKNPLIG